MCRDSDRLSAMSVQSHPSPLFPYTTLFRSALGRGTRPWRDDPGGSSVQRVDLREPLAEQTNRSEEHTSELQSHSDLVCRLLLEKKNHICQNPHSHARARNGRHEWTFPRLVI